MIFGLWIIPETTERQRKIMKKIINLNRRIFLTSGLLAGGASFLISCKDNNENKKILKSTS